MFDYQRFENELAAAMEHTLRKWMEEYDGIYILSLGCARDMTSVGMAANTKQYLCEQSAPDSEDYWYYKYCEEEWEVCGIDGLEEISSYMNQYIEENDERFTDPETFEFLEPFEEHCDQMIDACEKALVRLRQAVSKDFPDLLLAFHIREYLAAEERTEIFARLNSRDAAKEYAEHIDAFN